MGLKGCFFTISTIVAFCIVPLLVNGLPVTREASKKSTFCSLPWNRKTCESLWRPFARDPINPYVPLPPFYDVECPNCGNPKIIGKSQQVLWKFCRIFSAIAKKNVISRGVVPGGAMALSDFGRSVNPISTRGTDYAHLITTGTPWFSDRPTALSL